jgi:hypothetical protein
MVQEDSSSRLLEMVMPNVAQILASDLWSESDADENDERLAKRFDAYERLVEEGLHRTW